VAVAFASFIGHESPQHEQQAAAVVVVVPLVV
jgi:hypothetical protein